MADQKITALTELAEADVASTDVLPIADVSASETKKVTVKSLVEQGVDLIDDASIPSAKLAAITPSSLGSSSTAKEFIAGPTGAGGAYTSRVIAPGDLPVATDAALGAAQAGTGLSASSGTFSVDAATTSALGGISVPSASGLSVDGSGVISHQSSVTGQTKNGFTVNASGHITAVGSIAAGDLPKATSSAVGGVFIGSGLSVTASGQLNHTDSITAGTTSGITFNSEGHITATTALTGTDLPAGTTTAKGGLSVPSGALSVSGAGALTHDNSGVTAGTYPKVTVDARGHVTAGTTLSASDIPDISAAKLTSGTIGTSLIANDAVTGAKLASSSVTRFAGAPDTDGVVNFGTADFDGQFLYDATNENLYIYTGTAFKSIDIVSGEIVFAGTYDASTNLVASVTAKGTAIGLTVGQALIAPAASNLNHYLTVSKSGTGSGNAPAEALAPPDFLLSTGTAWQVLDLSTALAATAASNVSFSPTGNIAADNVQSAIAELDSEKASLAGPTFTGTTTFSGDVLLGTSATLTFEGSSADDYETSFTFTNPTADRSIAFPDSSGTVILTGDTGTVTNGMLAGSIALTKLANLTSGQLIVGNSSNVPTGVALSGDATISNTGALTIANDAVTAAKLADTSVTAGSYTAADITVDAQGRITAAASGTIGTAEIADDAVTADKLADTAVTAGSYTAADITVDAQGRVTAAASGTIGTSEIANDAVTADKLADTSVTAGSYTAADITVDAQGRITSAASGTIGTSEIADDAVTADKLADTSVTAGSYTFSSITVDAQGRITAASSGTQADTDKISEGNTEAEVVDTGSDGHFKVTTENTERIRVGPAGQIGIAGANYGTSGQVLTSGGASGAISWANASASASFEATASGAIANGDPCVILSDGKVAAVSEAFQSNLEGSEAQFDNSQFISGHVAYHPVADRVVAVYRDTGDSNKGKAALGTISGTTITWNTTNSTYESASEARFNQIVYDEKNERMVVIYNHLLNGGHARVMSISGNTITYGTALNFHTGDCQEMSAVYDPSSGKIVACYRDSSDSSKQKANVLTVDPSNNTISSGTAVVIANAQAGADCELAYDPSSEKIVLALKDQSNYNKGTAYVGSVTGTGMSWGGRNVFQDTSEANAISMTYDESIKRIVICYNIQTDSSPTALTAKVDGYSITFGTKTEISDAECRDPFVVYDPSLGKCCFVFRDSDATNDPMKSRFGKVRDDGIALDGQVTVVNDDCIRMQACFTGPHKNVFVVYDKNTAGTQTCRGVVIRGSGQASNLIEAANYIGIADAAYSDGDTATIQIASAVDDAQSGLRIGQKYFVQRDGGLAVNPDFPEVFAGTAVAATKLIVKG